MLRFPCGVALVWLMADSDERGFWWSCYRTELVREAGGDSFLSKIKKVIHNGVVMGHLNTERASEQGEIREVTSGPSPC